jgi:3-phenylpropionate/cinnamic acid dioxygenase small subunit
MIDGWPHAEPLARLLLQNAVECFYATECMLLDERRYDEWLDLLTEDIRYIMPLTRNFRRGDAAAEFTSAGSQTCWFDDRKDDLRRRVLQIQSGDHWADEPVSRTTHIVANVLIEEADADTVTVKSRFLVYRHRLDRESNTFVGKRTDVLVRTAEGIRLRRRSLYLDETVMSAKHLTTFL